MIRLISVDQDLVEDLKSELGGHFESVVVGLMMSTVEYCAKQLHKAMKGGGTDEETLVEILCSRTNEEVKRIADAYEKGNCAPKKCTNPSIDGAANF